MFFRHWRGRSPELTNLFETGVRMRRSPGGVAASCVAHGAVLALVYLALHSTRIHPIAAESRCCSTAMYWSPSAAHSGAQKTEKITAQNPRPTPNSAAQAKLNAPQKPAAAAKKSSTQTGMASPQQLATLGTGDGSDNAEPALPLYYPSPGITDRSLLPAAKQNIVVDVNISAMGDVTDEKLVRGLGNALDQLVLAAVKTWRFHPATLNGTAVASMQELVFPFDKDWEPNQAGASG